MIAEKYEEMSGGVEEAMASVSDCMHRTNEQFSHMVEEHPARSLIMAGLAGFGVGILLSTLFQQEKTTHSAFDRSTTERFGRNLLERVENALPAMLRDRLK